MLEFEGRWRFESPGELSGDVVSDVFTQIICKVVSQGDRQDLLEIFKRRFAQAAGKSSIRSSSESWAESDLLSYMQDASENAALFIEALYDGLLDTTKRLQPATIPPWPYVNQVLAPSGYAIDPPVLSMGALVTPVAVPTHVPSLDAQANSLIQTSLSKSETFLTTGEYRAAVQEILWLLETISTAFQGAQYPDGDVTGKYFSKIIGDLRRLNHGRTLSQVIGWMESVYGYLSSPTGGAIRHGATLNSGLTLTEGEARLYCDLTRSYINYLLHEHAQLR
ncbi:hypothetical protein K6V72_10125 [Ralstonia insidiosa]|jgi:hypothetical protein|uniref:hypothetical protein n=1 Tax=Ralstonia TaxID=48736 RepID=UPI000CEE6522|nr:MULTISPECIES: hypothetical protein [Ralstonia]KAB0471136.1 hypothetical protein F7R11_00565 [Ralstonia insidiosa]MBY4909349.1 hypothetical protein [Ralstonia insidiosa]MDH6643360.1 hypothetical protein [Ralstonia sp. GP73]